MLAALHAADARVFAQQASVISVPRLVQFYRDLSAAYPDARRLAVVQDKWPMPAHPDLLAALEPQERPFPPARPPHWPTEASPAAQRRWGALKLPSQLVWLPTYASWLHPIAKLWRRLRQALTHMHPDADTLADLRQAITTVLDGVARGSPSLTRYVGLAIAK